MNSAVKRTRSPLLAVGLVVLLYGAPHGLITPAAGQLNFSVEIEGDVSVRTVATGFQHALQHPPGDALAHAELVVTKPVDHASPLIARWVCEGVVAPTVRLEARRTSPEGTQYYAVRLKDVLISSVAPTKPSPASPPSETVGFNYTRIEWTYITTDDGGQAGQAGATEWDLVVQSGGTSDPDTDGDGMSDSYEVLHNLKLLEHDADDDTDRDGMTNGEEYRAGTSASNSNSVFRVTGIAVPLSGVMGIQISFNSVPDRVYDLYAADTIGAPPDLVRTVTAVAETTTLDLSLPGGRAFVLVKVREP